MNNKPITVVCLRQGDDYCNTIRDEYVTRLRDAVKVRLQKPHKFICYTDHPTPGVECRPPLEPTWEGWWGKLAFFSDFMPGHRIIYLDLDLVLCGDLGLVADWPQDFGIASDFLQSTPNSSVFVVDSGSHAEVYEEAKRLIAGKGVRHRCGIKAHGTLDHRSDQEFIREALNPRGVWWRQFPMAWFPPYKWGGPGGTPITTANPFGAIAVLFHGSPKMHEAACDGTWVREVWG